MIGKWRSLILFCIIFIIFIIVIIFYYILTLNYLLFLTVLSIWISFLELGVRFKIAKLRIFMVRVQDSILDHLQLSKLLDI